MPTGSPEGFKRRNSIRPSSRNFPAPDTYDAAITTALDRVRTLESSYERERAEATGLVKELLSHPQERRELIGRNSPRFHTWGVYERLLSESWGHTFALPEQAERLASLALQVSEHLEAKYDTRAVEDLRARAWAYIGNSRRSRADLAGAGDAFREAHSHLRQGTGDPVELAVLLDLVASFLRAQRHFDHAMRLLRRALKIYLSVGDCHRAGRILICMDLVHSQAGTPEQGIPLLYQAVKLIDPTQEPLLLLCVWHNLADDLTEVGRFAEAQKVFLQAHKLYKSVPAAILNRHRWLAGRIAVGLGREQEGEEKLLAARQGFVAADAAYDVALVSFDLSALYARQGRIQELKQITVEMVPFFSSRQIHREAAAALAYWKHAVDTETAGFDLANRLFDFLKRSRFDRDLPFEPPS